MLLYYVQLITFFFFISRVIADKYQTKSSYYCDLLFVHSEKEK